MGTDSAFFVLGLVGALVGYIVGDFQRERRWRRDARENFRLSVDRLPGSHRDPDPRPNYVEFVRSGFDNVPATLAVSGSDSDSDADSGPSWALGSVRDRESRRRAVSRPDLGSGSPAGVRSRGVRRTAPAALASADYDCG